MKEVTSKGLSMKIKPKMTLPELVKQLKVIAQGSDSESDHLRADDLLLKFINKPSVTKAYSSIKKWYA